MKQVVIIDGKWLGYKMHFSHLNLKSNGVSTGMLYGFVSELLRINRRLPEARIIVCWDGEKKTWRHKTFKAYKADRPFNPEFERMTKQTDLLLPFLRLLGIWVLRIDDVEADDMIGMVATRLAKKKTEVRIHSKDHDMFQLVNDYVWVWPDVKMPPLRRSDVEHWLGAPFDSFLEIRAMAGDPGDGLKGLPGVGMKTAVKLWKQGLRISDISNGALWSKYKEHWKRVKEEQKLARIIIDPASSIWTKETRTQLVELVERVANRPERDGEWAERHRREIYRFLGQYELKELLAERQKLFRLP